MIRVVFLLRSFSAGISISVAGADDDDEAPEATVPAEGVLEAELIDAGATWSTYEPYY